MLGGSIVLLGEMFGDDCCWIHNSRCVGSCSGTLQVLHLSFCLGFRSSWPSPTQHSHLKLFKIYCMGNLSPSIICFKMSYSFGQVP